ncbi:TPA: transcription antitermination factor NusB [Candidatus Berkelbacteria bacterium]|uniref:Transcription antitermination protein NusB n=1 Tax=Berkelbacteria bacterium GW2011_GWE1_39_12 TaxID=1618337 RepID=A0A0G4B5T3_9BACT|nr:MAG: putative transcription termination factor [Berkelbacteria bacterium GW2011_GWE1_39_12]HBO60161.1 transcription antitermination factor NusB [Candidatus Berkelbacteria bacterium]
MNRHLSRVIIMQSLYEWDFRPDAALEEIKQRNIENYNEDADKEFIDNTISGVIKNIEQEDKLITEAAPEWPLEQISAIDKTILRIAIFEILFSEDIPPKVAINEAVELGKTFGGENSSKFINGVLGTVYRKSPKYDPTQDEKELKKDE